MCWILAISITTIIQLKKFNVDIRVIYSKSCQGEENSFWILVWVSLEFRSKWKMCILLWLWVPPSLLGHRSHFPVCCEPPTGQFWFISSGVWSWCLESSVLCSSCFYCEQEFRRQTGESHWLPWVTVYCSPTQDPFHECGFSAGTPWPVLPSGLLR